MRPPWQNPVVLLLFAHSPVPESAVHQAGGFAPK